MHYRAVPATGGLVSSRPRARSSDSAAQRKPKPMSPLDSRRFEQPGLLPRPANLLREAFDPDRWPRKPSLEHLLGADQAVGRVGPQSSRFSESRVAQIGDDRANVRGSGASRTRTGDLLGAIGPGSVRPGSPRLVRVTQVEPGSFRFAQFGITIGSTDVGYLENIFHNSPRWSLSRYRSSITWC
jgi:hypothetical protein